MKCFKSLAIILSVIMVISCQKDEDLMDVPFDPAKDNIVLPKKEIRAAWVTTVYNLDWPTTKNNASAQKAELQQILDYCQKMNFNAVILQIRPMADSFYPSSLEPWSQFLTGTQGTDPGYDPLGFAIEEAHKRGMEFHAWLNPYRIGPTTYTLASSHVAVKNPDWMVTFSDARYFNPGIPEVMDHLKNVVKDIITKYDVDAIHFDDYFYPSGAKSTSNPFGFNDKAAWEKYGGGKDIHTWRADNVSKMVSEVNQLIHSTKPGVLFGISPAGRRENSLDLYADPLMWLNNKWVDYLAPQIYWEFGHATAPFDQLASYWNGNANGIAMIIGIASYKFKDPAYPAYGSTSQFDRQIDLVRLSTNLSGCFFFREKFLENSELNAYMKGKYPYKSVLPFMGTTILTTPNSPVVTAKGTTMSWSPVANGNTYAVYLLERSATGKNSFNAWCVQISGEVKFTGEAGKSYYVTAVNRDNAESKPSAVLMVK
jgi:uncharacterized lipoprotein YddW (UPF0748 family)